MVAQKQPKLNRASVVMNYMLTRTAFLKSLIDQGKRDIDRECGYIENPNPDNYKALYAKEGIAARVVRVYPEESWQQDPEVVEGQSEEDTEFEKAWDKLVKEFNLYHYLYRADELSGIGRFGLLLIGIDDGRTLNLPIAGLDKLGNAIGDKQNTYKLTYLRPLDETVVKVAKYETDSSSPRFGKPTMYEVKFVGDEGSETSSPTKTLQVHWHRVIHVADNRVNSEIFGTPRMQEVYNRLYDLRKVLGGSGEMFWKGGFPGFSFETLPELGDVQIDKKSLQDEFEQYQLGLQRFIALQGMTAKNLAPQVADPTAHMMAHLRAIAITLGVPHRILMGSEQAQLASSQDVDTWNKRLKRRQDKYISPCIIRPFVDRLIALGIMPKPKDAEGYEVVWPDLGTPTDSEKADVGLKRAQALAAYINGSVEQIVGMKSFLTLILGMSTEEADACLQEAVDLVHTTTSESETNADETGGAATSTSKQQVEKKPKANPFKSNSATRKKAKEKKRRMAPMKADY